MYTHPFYFLCNLLYPTLFTNGLLVIFIPIIIARVPGTKDDGYEVRDIFMEGLS